MKRCMAFWKLPSRSRESPGRAPRAEESAAWQPEMRTVSDANWLGLRNWQLPHPLRERIDARGFFGGLHSKVAQPDVPDRRRWKYFFHLGQSMQLTAVLMPAGEGGFVALNPETGTTSQGETIQEAIANLTEATSLYLEEFPDIAPGHTVVTTFTLP